MASKKNKARAAKEQTTRKFKKKTSILLIEDIEYIDYKDVDLLSRFVSDRAKIRNRRVTGNDLQQQREVANAVKIAREMALLPYAKRVSSQRTRPPRGEGRPDRREPDGRGSRGRSQQRGSRGARRDRSRGRRVRRARRGGSLMAKVILRSDLEGLGLRGDIVDVSDGHARNYLFPRGLAIVATEGAVHQAAKMRVGPRPARQPGARKRRPGHRLHARAEGHHGEGEGRLRGSPVRFGHVCRHRRCRRGRDRHRARSQADPGRCHQDSRPAHGHRLVALRRVVPDHDRRRRPSRSVRRVGRRTSCGCRRGPCLPRRGSSVRACRSSSLSHPAAHIAAMLATHRPQAAHRRRPVAHRVTHSNWP